MRRFLKLIGSLSLWGLCGRYPVTAGVMTLLGVGGVIVAGALTPPSITPQPSAAFGQSDTIASSSDNILRPNGGTQGAEYPPATPTNSQFFYVEGSVNPALGTNATRPEYMLGTGQNSRGLLLTSDANAPSFVIQKNWDGTGYTPFWKGLTGQTFNTSPSVVQGTGYLEGYYPWTAAGGGCSREPSGIVGPTTAGTIAAAIADPGFLCSTTPTVGSIAGQGAKQATGAGSATSCAVVNREAVVTAQVATATGIVPGQTYALSGFTPTGYNSTVYTALSGTSGTTLVGTTGAASCPGTVTAEGNALSGTGGAVNLTAFSTTTPWSNSHGTGITTRPGQHFCGVFGEYGADSPTPGFQYAAFTDREGNALPGSPAVVPWPNQGATNFTGYTTTITQNGTNGGALTVTAMNAYAITAATYSSGTGYVSFTTSAASGLIVGSEFTVSGVTPSGYNQTYIAVAGTGGTTIVGNPLAAPLGMPQALANPGAYSSGGSLVGVIVPGMHILGGTGAAVVLPYGTFGSSGTGGVGTYGLGANQVTTVTATVTSVTAPLGGFSTMTVMGTPSSALVVGVSLSGITGYSNPVVITALGTGIGAAGTYTVSNSNTGSFSGSVSATLAGTIGSSGSPVTIYAWDDYYYIGAASTAAGGGAVTARTAASIGDFFSYIGGYSAAIPSFFPSWGGALANVGDFFGVFPLASNQPSATALALLCKKTTDFQSFATANSLNVNSLYRLNDTGVWGDSSVAQFNGSITGASGTVAGTATLNLLTPINGASTVASMPSGTVISGAGIAGCPALCPKLTTPATGQITFGAGVTSANVAAETLAAGAYQPATPTAENGFSGYVSGNTLTVTSVASANKAIFTATTALPTNSFVGRIDNGDTGGTGAKTGNLLCVTTAPSSPNLSTVTPGTAISWAGAPVPNPVIVSNGTGGAGTSIPGCPSGLGGAGAYILDQSIAGGVAAGTTFTGVFAATAGNAGNLDPTSLVVSSVASGTIIAGMLVTDGSGHAITGQPLLITGQQSGTTGGAGTYNLAPHYYPVIGTGETMYGVSTQLVPGQYLRDDSTHTVTTPIKIIGYGTGANAPGLCTTGEWGCGTYTILNPAGLAIGSSGSPVAFTASGTSDGAAIAPGSALTIKDPGPGVTFPVTNYGAGTGTLWLSGAYDTASLGGTPSAIQAQVSMTAGGPPVSGCSACAWTNVAGSTISGRAWSGKALNIPAGGPYFVSVRAANGTSYATLPSQIKVGLAFDVWGVGQSQPLLSASNGGWAFSTYPGLWGVNQMSGTAFYNYDVGPSVSGQNLFPNYTQMVAGDQLAINGGGAFLSEGARDLGVNLQNALGYPVTVSNWTRDGAALGMYAWGGTTQSQTIGLGDGVTATWCSRFCASAGVSNGGKLSWNLASLTGSQITAKIDNGSGAAGNTLTVSGITTGALEPGLVLSDSFTGGGAHIAGSPTLVNCLTNCGGIGGATSTWTISGAAQLVASETMRADPPGAASAPFYNPAALGLPLVTQKGHQVIKAGTFSVSVNGTVICTDTNVFPAYSLMGGNCTGAGVSSSFVNYVTGDYQITFATAPAANAVITASWVENVSPSDPVFTNVFNNLDFTGTGPDTSGYLSSVFSRMPGGSSGHIMAACFFDTNVVEATGYPTGAVGYSQYLDWFYGTRIPSLFTGSNSLPYMSPTTPLISANFWRMDGLPGFLGGGLSGLPANGLCDQWAVDLTVNSTFTGTIGSVSGAGPSTATLTLTAAASGPMWEGEVISCPTFSLTCAIPAGTYIASLLTGTWGAAGSTYALANQTSVPIAAIGSVTAMANGVYYSAGPSIYAGGMNDLTVVPSTSGINGSDGYSPHPSFGVAGAPRAMRKWSAEIYGGLTGNGTKPPTLDRVKASAGGCDTSAIASPCFDVDSTYQASAAATWTGAVATITGGLAAHARSFVPGMAIGCSGCNSGLVVTAVSAPPTQSTITGQGQIGQTFTVTANAAIGGSGSGTITGGCSGTAGAGSNCIDIAFSVNTPGSYGSAAALATCGENNLNGTATPYTVPNGTCSSNGVGSLVHNFRIGTQQNAWGGVTPGQQPSAGSVYDDGVDPFTSGGGGGFNQSAAFTCNIVAAKVVQCVKGAAYSSGVVTGVGQWASGSTFIEYGDSVVGTGRSNSLMGNVGGQPFAFTAGSGYTPGTYTIPASNCVTSTGTYTLPQVDVTVGSGGSIVDVYGSAAAQSIGFAVGNGCSFNLGASITASITGSGVSAVLNVTGLSSGGLAKGQTLTGSGVPAGVTLNVCTKGCNGNPAPSGFIPTTTTAQTWTFTGCGSCTAVSSESMTTAFAAMGAGTGGVVGAIPVQPFDGTYGIASPNTGSNLMGDELYDNSGFVGNPLHSFFDNGMGGYFEPGLPVVPFGMFLGAAVSG